jgi:hypothetical protein
MASKLGFLLSLFFVVQIMGYAGDLSCLQAIHSELDAVAVAAGELIAEKGSLSQAVKDYVYQAAKASIEAVSPLPPKYGQIYEFRLTRSFQPLILSPNPMTVTVKRAVVIGYLG